MKKRDQKRPKRGVRAAGIIMMWGVAPALFFVLGFLVLGPWYANAGWFNKPPKPAMEVPGNLDDSARGAWFDEAAIPDRLGPVGGGDYSRTRRPRASFERSRPVESSSRSEEAVVIGGDEVGVPPDVPIYEGPTGAGGADVQPPGLDVQPPDSID